MGLFKSLRKSTPTWSNLTSLKKLGKFWVVGLDHDLKKLLKVFLGHMLTKVEVASWPMMR